MKLCVSKSFLTGDIAVPGSKSHTIRGISAALLGTGKSILRAPLDSEDTRSALEAAKLFGARVSEFSDRWEITGTGGKFSIPGSTVNMNNSGTGLRMMTASCFAAARMMSGTRRSFAQSPPPMTFPA